MFADNLHKRLAGEWSVNLGEETYKISYDGDVIVNGVLSKVEVSDHRNFPFNTMGFFKRSMDNGSEYLKVTDVDVDKQILIIHRFTGSSEQETYKGIPYYYGSVSGRRIISKCFLLGIHLFKTRILCKEKFKRRCSVNKGKNHMRHCSANLCCSSGFTLITINPYLAQQSS